MIQFAREIAPEVSKRRAHLDWDDIYKDLQTDGYAVMPSVLQADECRELIGLYAEEAAFRSRVVMARHGYGRGEYKYLNYPLPQLVGDLRATYYPPLRAIANQWNEAMAIDSRYPDSLTAFLRQCHAAGQNKPTPLLLKYGPDDYNCLHQDLYGETVFPLQIAFLLSDPDVDFTGGEFVMTEQRPRMQSRVMVVPLQQGDGVIFPVRQRPVQGAKRRYRVNHRHGVSRVRSGNRHTLGIIFHDAQ
jgi:hypothetical protein